MSFNSAIHHPFRPVARRLPVHCFRNKDEDVSDDTNIGSDDNSSSTDSNKYAKKQRQRIEETKVLTKLIEDDARALKLGDGFERTSIGESRGKTGLQSAKAGRCCISPPLKVQRLNTKDMKHRAFFDMCEKASVFLGFNFTPPSYSVHNSSNIRDRSTRRPILDFSEPDRDESTSVPFDFAPSVLDTESTKLTRFACTSPWLTIVLELLTGQELREDMIWVYPFKYYVVYERQIKEFVTLLNKIDLETFNPKDLISTLGEITRTVKSSAIPVQVELEYSTDGIDRLLRRKYINHNMCDDSPSNSNPSLDEMGSEGDGVAQTERDGMSALSACISSDEETALPRKSTYNQSGVICTCIKDAREHLKLVVDELDNHLSGLLTLRHAIEERSIRTIRFPWLWHLYYPGDVVVSSMLPYQAYRVLHVSGGRSLLTKSMKRQDRLYGAPDDGDYDGASRVSPFKLDLIRFDFDGEYYGPCHITFSIKVYDGEKEITDLDVYPIQFAEGALRRSLVERGQRFTRFKDFEHMKYVGWSLDYPNKEIESEVIVDFKQAFRQSSRVINMPRFGMRRLSTPDGGEVHEERCHQCLGVTDNCILDDTQLDNLWTTKFLSLEETGILLVSRHKRQSLTEDQTILLPGGVYAFSLRHRSWDELDIDILSHIGYEDTLDGQSTAFEDLVIPEEYIKTVKALVRSHVLGSRDADSHGFDLIRGKGKGLIILLHGVPGIGKTSTAESVATYTKRPLFPITCGNIGQTANDAERKLEEIFLLARKWGCVLLLDEADVFLERRERGGSSVDRNALISVCLRTLEYYSGILFLTTNRIGSFDEAFISRIHISLYYPGLDQESTYKVWMMNLKRLKESGHKVFVSEEQILAFAKDHWRLGKDGSRCNGRQIRNAFQTALALAEYVFHEKCKMHEQTGNKKPLMPALLPDHFRAVAQTSAEFDNYLLHVQGGATHKEKARLAQIRSDDWKDEGEETSVGKKYSMERAVRPK